MDGWILIHRKIIEWEWYADVNVRLTFLHLLLKVNHTDNKWKGIDVKRGQTITSYSKLSEEIGISVQALRTALKKLINTQEINIKSTNRYIVVTIEKYDFYQQPQTQVNKQVTINQQSNNNQSTNNQQQTNNDKERIKNEKRNFIPPTLEEVKKYCQERMNSVDAGMFIDFYESKGWMVGKNKMRDWKACVRTWEKSNKSNSKSQSTTTIKKLTGADEVWESKSEEEKERIRKEMEMYS